MNVVLNRIVVVDSDSVQDYIHPDDQTLSTFEMTPGFKPFTVILSIVCAINLVKKKSAEVRSRELISQI